MTAARPSSAALRAARRKSSRMNAGLVCSVAATTGSQSVTSSEAPRRRARRGGGARSRVGQRQLDRQVDPAGTRRERRLERLGPVGREHEDQVGVLVEAVHRVEQLEQQRRGLVVAPVAARSGRRPRPRSSPARASARGCRRCRWRRAQPPVSRITVRSGIRPGEVHDRQRLARPGRSVEQQAAAYVTAACAQPLAVSGDAGGVALDPLERPLGQHDPARGASRQRANGERRRAGTGAPPPNAKHLAAVDIVLAHQLAQPGQPRFGDLTPGRHRLEADAARILFTEARRKQHSERSCRPHVAAAGPTSSS